MNCDFCYLKIEWRLYIIFNKSHISEKYCLETARMHRLFLYSFWELIEQFLR